MRYGTSYFPYRAAAVAYFRPYGYTRMEFGGVEVDDTEAAVAQKIAEGSIHIGKPPLKPGETCRLVGSAQYGWRYYVKAASTASRGPSDLSLDTTS